LTTTREHFGTALATAARLYADAEHRGDLARAAAYAVAVEALLKAWPSDDEPQCSAVRPSCDVVGPSDWPVCEQTLTGLGIAPERLEASVGP
jgi:hypothetical protein